MAEVLTLAADGAVEVPGAPINCLVNFFGLCAVAGETPFAGQDQVISADAGVWALERLRELMALCPAEGLARNPIQSLELLASAANTRLAYCLFPYGYSNYACDGYAEHSLKFGDVPVFAAGRPLITTLGGTGLAISARTSQPSLAADYAAFVASGRTQRTLYARSGGQPGHRSAWVDHENNRLTHDYFRATLPALDRAFVRPRHAGYLHGFQEPAGPIVHRCMRGMLTPRAALAELDTLYAGSFNHI